VEGYIVGI
jgi:hypothetical protein